MSKLTHLIYWVLILVLSILLWQAYGDSDAEAETAIALPRAERPAAGVEPATAVGSTETAIELVDNGHPSSLHREIESSTPPRTQGQAIVNVDAIPEDEATQRMLKQLQRAERYPDLLQTEGIDQDWNYQVSSDVKRIFSEVTGLPEEYLGEVNCRMTLCEVQVSARTTAPIDTMMRLQKALIEMPWYTDAYSTLFDATDDGGFYRIYLERERP